MSRNEFEFIASARAAAKHIGHLLRSKQTSEETKTAAIALLDELSNYDPDTVDILSHEMQLGMLEALIPDIVFNVNCQLRQQAIKKDNKAHAARREQ